MNAKNYLSAFTAISVVAFAAPAVAHDSVEGNSMTAPTPALDSGGNGMAKLSHFDLYAGENARTARMDSWRADREEARREAEAKRAREEKEFSFGNDVPGLQGLQPIVALNGLHHLNLKEIALAKMAESTAKSEDVLNMAHRLRADHEQLEKKVEAVASDRNLSLEPFRLAEPEQAVSDRLKKLDGAEFEAAFLRVMERGHMEAGHMLRIADRVVRDAQVQGLVEETLPVVMAHHRALNQENRARAAEEEGSLGE